MIQGLGRAHNCASQQFRLRIRPSSCKLRPVHRLRPQLQVHLISQSFPTTLLPVGLIRLEGARTPTYLPTSTAVETYMVKAGGRGRTS